MNCRDLRDVVDSFLSDELLTETNHEILLHLDTCPSCRAEIAGRRQLRGSLRAAFDRTPDLQPPPDFAKRLREHMRVAAADARRDRPFSRRWLVLAASAVLTVGLGGAVFMTQLMGPVDALARDAIGDHWNCALKTARLQNGDVFPRLAIDVVGGRTITLPDDLAGSYAVILFYRGSWCPYCGAQLAAFSRASDRLAAAGVALVALSVDDEATSKALIDKLRLSFPVGFGANVDNIAAATGAYVSEGSAYLQSTGFVLDPGGGILTAVYSRGAIGRLVPDDVAGLVKYIDAHRDTTQAAAIQTR